MPDPKDDAKLTGDVHPPEAEDQREGARGRNGSLERELADESAPGKGENQAGFLKDREGSLSGGKP